jgi:hypothetical protein
VANFKRRRPSGRHSSYTRNPYKKPGNPPDGKYRVSELRKLGGRASRMRRKDVDWRFPEEG